MAGSTKDFGYELGDLSQFPVALDTSETMYRTANNAQTVLYAAIQPLSTLAVLRDGSKFPLRNTVIRIDNELILYEERQGDRIFGLMRGFAGTSPSTHAANAEVIVPVIADLHCMIRDAIIRIEKKIGFPTDVSSSDPYDSLYARMKFLRKKWLTPRCLFYAFARSGHAPFGVQFVDLSYGDPVRWVWEFGDGSVSIQQNPYHVYSSPGSYVVGLTIYTPDNGVAAKVKQKYITVLEDSDIDTVLFYANEVTSSGQLTDNLTGKAPFKVRFTDQTIGAIESRIWTFGDGATEISNSADDYVVEHTYTSKGTYWPSLVVTGSTQSARKVMTRPVNVA